MVAAAIVAIVTLAYWPALGGDFIWDDDDYVAANATLTSADGLRAIWLEPSATPQYYPLVHTSYWLEYHLWGLAPAGYHVTNVALHLTSTFLLWRVLLLLGVPGAPLIAALFAVHPVNVESVAWITERKNALSGVFYFLSMLAYLHFALDHPPDRERQRRQYGLALVLFFCALLSKTVTATLPAALLVLIVWKRGRLRWADVRPLIPFFIAGAAMGLMTAWIEKHVVGAAGVDWALSLPQRFVIAGRAVWFYAGKLFWPARLTFIYPRWQVDAADPRQLAYPVAAVVIGAALWFARSRIGAGALVAVLLFAGTLFPALGFVDTFPMRYSFVADHFQYLAGIALIALAVGAAASATADRPVADRWARSAGALAVVTLAALTWQQAHIYANQETLWADTIRKDPTSWMGHTSLGAILGRRGDLVDAERHYREAVRLNPAFAIARVDLGGLLANEGRVAEAVPHFREAVRLDPGSLPSRLSLGRALMIVGDADGAVACLQDAVARWPDDPEARSYLQQAILRQHAHR